MELGFLKNSMVWILVVMIVVACIASVTKTYFDRLIVDLPGDVSITPDFFYIDANVHEHVTIKVTQVYSREYRRR